VVYQAYIVYRSYLEKVCSIFITSSIEKLYCTYLPTIPTIPWRTASWKISL